MVATTLVKLTGHIKYPKVKSGLPGTTLSSLRHYMSAAPIYFFTIAGGIVCALYVAQLGSYKDTTILKAKTFKDISPDAKVPLFYTKEVVSDLKAYKEPEKRPQVKEGQTFES